MSNLIQIKRSLGAGAANTPGSLNPGELAFTSNGTILYIGNTSSVVPIAGLRVPGVATANQALVLSNTGTIDVLYATNTLTVGNSTVNTVVNSTYLSTANLALTTGIALGANVVLDTTHLGIGNSTVNVYANSTLITIADATGSANLQPSHLYIGTTVVNSTTLAAGANVIANTTAVYVGNSVANTVQSQGGLVIANSTFSLTLGPNSLTTGNLVANATTILMGANVVITTSSITVGNSTVNTFSNSSLVSVVGDVTATANVSATNINASANVTTVILNARDGIFSGNLVVHGGVTNIDAVNLAVSDPLIKLANNNATTDTVDIGWYGLYGNSTVTQYTGIFRDASDAGIIKTFRGNIGEPTTVVDTANVNFDYAVLESWLTSGALVSNSTVINITANSTVSSTIAANTLTLSTGLAATSGGTGHKTYTSGDILVANTGNALSVLGLGSDGYVMQVSGTSVVWSTLDGGTF